MPKGKLNSRKEEKEEEGKTLFIMELVHLTLIAQTINLNEKWHGSRTDKGLTS